MLTIEILGGNRAMLDDLLREAHRASLPKNPGVNILSARHDDWCRTSWRHRRPLGSIVLADSLLEDLLADMRQFLASGPWYALRGIPHRRGSKRNGMRFP